MPSRIFVDTNVLVYAYDRADPAKQRQARQVLAQLVEQDRGVISAQVLAEFFVTVTRKIPAPLNVADAYRRVQTYQQTWTVWELTGSSVLEAARGVRDHQLNLWDAHIWAVARLNQAQIVFSEDFAAGSVLEGVRFVNPFAENFSLAEWA